VFVAIGADLGVGLAKVCAAVFTGSSAMAAAAADSLADTANDLFLLVAQRRSGRPADDRHPLGYGREAYFWALFAALGVFIAGAAFSLREGIDELIHPSTTSSFAVAYVVLAISAGFDLVSIRQSAGQMIRQTRGEKDRVVALAGDAPDRPADRHDRHVGRVHLGPVHDPDDVHIKFRPGRLELQDVLNYSAITSDPTLRGVFNEDIASILADGVALVALAVNQITGSSIAEGVAAVLIGATLIRVGLRLVQRNRDFLLGQPTQQFDTERIRSLLLGYPGVSAIRELIVTFVGPGRIWIIARVDVDQGLSGDQVTSLVRGIESSAKQASDNVYRVDVMPVSGAQASP